MTYLEEHLKYWHQKFAVGDRVRHSNTRQWGVVKEVKPTHYGVELLVTRVVDEHHNDGGEGYWEGIRIDLHRRDGQSVA